MGLKSFLKGERILVDKKVNFRGHLGWILVDIMGEFFWSLMDSVLLILVDIFLVNFWGHFWWMLVDTIWHFFGEFSWTFFRWIIVDTFLYYSKIHVKQVFCNWNLKILWIQLMEFLQYKKEDFWILKISQGTFTGT